MKSFAMKQFSHASPVFPVENPKTSADYYHKVLGFDITFEWGDPPSYVVINREEAVGIHLVQKEDDFTPSKAHVSLFVFVNDVDRLYQEYQQSGAKITNPIGDRDYGMRDFDVTDPNGFILTFGCGLS